MASMTAEAEAWGLPQSRSLTRADLADAPDDGHRYELIDGVLIVSPAPSQRHQRASFLLAMRLEAACPPEFQVIPAPFNVVLAVDTVVQPDILVGRIAEFTDADLPAAPVLAVEVLSPSTWRFDLVLKRSRFESAGVAHYWVVDPAEPSITVWTLTDGAFAEPRRAVGDEELVIDEPFALRLRPRDLVD
jgi:Uma2 family endonuclease